MQAIEERIYYRDDPVRQSEQNKIADVMEGTFRRIKRLFFLPPPPLSSPEVGEEEKRAFPRCTPLFPSPLTGEGRVRVRSKSVPPRWGRKNKGMVFLL